MMRIVLAFVTILISAILVLGKDRPTVTVQVVDSKASDRIITHTIPAKAGKSTTTCDTNGTATDSGNSTNVNANTDCTTTTAPGTPAQTGTTSIPQEHVRVIMPDGAHVTLWCQEGFRRCAYLQPGKYDAELKGDSAWIHAPDLSGKVHKIKYHAVGGW